MHDKNDTSCNETLLNNNNHNQNIIETSTIINEQKPIVTYTPNIVHHTQQQVTRISGTTLVPPTSLFQPVIVHPAQLVPVLPAATNHVAANNKIETQQLQIKQEPMIDKNDISGKCLILIILQRFTPRTYIWMWKDCKE